VPGTAWPLRRGKDSNNNLLFFGTPTEREPESPKSFTIHKFPHVVTSRSRFETVWTLDVQLIAHDIYLGTRHTACPPTSCVQMCLVQIMGEMTGLLLPSNPSC
jgi:hypothetical protein